MVVRGKQIGVTAEELDTLLTGHTDNGVVDTIPEIVDYLESGTPVPSGDLVPISDDELDRICV